MKNLICNIGLAALFGTLIVACGAPAGGRGGGGGGQSQVACDTDSDCPSGQTCTIGASKPGDDDDDDWGGFEDDPWADGGESWDDEESGSTDKPAGDDQAAMPETPDSTDPGAAATPEATSNKAGVCVAPATESDPQDQAAPTPGENAAPADDKPAANDTPPTTDESKPADTAPQCDGAWSLGETFYKGETAIGQCNKSTPTNCADGVWISFDDGDCMCIVRCSSLQSKPGIGDACNSEGTSTCQKITANNGNYITACVMNSWNLCHETPSE